MRKLLTIFLLNWFLAGSVFGQFQQKPMLGQQINWAHPLAPDAGCWLINEGSGNKVFDVSGNNLIGTNNGAVWVSGHYGPALQFSKAEEISISDCSLLRPANLTVVAGVNIHTTVSAIGEHIASKNDSSGTEGWSFRVTTANVLTFGINAYSSNNATMTISLGQHIVAASYDGVNCRVYCDGLQGTPAADAGPISYDTDDMEIGRGFQADPYALDGDIDFVYLYNRALSASEIALLYRELFCFIEPSWNPILYGAVSVADWIGISSAHLDSYCGENALHTIAEALDGTDYWWHEANEEHWFILDLSQTYNVQKLRGRSYMSDYDPVDIDIYVSNDKANWGAAVATGITTWQDTTSWVEIDNTDKEGRYVKVLIVDTEHAENHIAWGSTTPFAILDVYGNVGTQPSGAQVIMINFSMVLLFAIPVVIFIKKRKN